MHEMGISAHLLAQALAGKKTIEGRLRNGKFLVMRKGDIVSLREDLWENDRIVASTPDIARIVIEESLFFDDFADMLSTINYKHAIPDAKSSQEALATYRQFYTEAQEHENGVVALRFSVLKNRRKPAKGAGAA